MDDVVVLEATHHMYNRVAFTYVGEEFVAQTLALARALDQAGNVDEFKGRVGDLFGMVHLRQLIQALVGNVHHAYIRLDSAEGIIRRLCAGAGNGVEECAFADVRQSYYA